MKYPVVQLDRARDWWFGWRAQCEEAENRVNPPKFDAVEYKRCVSEAGLYDSAIGVIDQLTKLYYAVDGADRNLDTNRFEANASVLMHRGLPECKALGDPEFWIWCAVVVGPNLIARRYPYKSVVEAESDEEVEGTVFPVEGLGKAEQHDAWIPHKSNFFSSSARETFFYRLWIRGRLGYVETEEDPYSLALCGDVDFWRSHIFRQMSLEAEPLRMEFIRFQFPDGPDGRPRLSQSKIRALIKRLRRAAANVVVDRLDRQQAREFILRQWESIDS